MSAAESGILSSGGILTHPPAQRCRFQRLASTVPDNLLLAEFFPVRAIQCKANSLKQ